MKTNIICKKYIKDIKSFFPIMGKDERKYIKKLTYSINEFFENAEITSKEDLYKEFGLPHNVVNTYFSSKNFDYILKKIRITKYIKIGIYGFLSLALIIATVCSITYAVNTYHTYKIFEEQQAFFEEITIE